MCVCNVVCSLRLNPSMLTPTSCRVHTVSLRSEYCLAIYVCRLVTSNPTMQISDIVEADSILERHKPTRENTHP